MALNYHELRQIIKHNKRNNLRSQNMSGLILSICLLMALICTLWAILATTTVHATPITTMPYVEDYTTDQWANAIHHAEGNDNYGILQHYTHTSYRQACINTVLHKHRDWVKLGRPGSFIHYLASKYAPVGATNDPGNLNRNWERNVQELLFKSMDKVLQKMEGDK